jgi:hypothetical protein
MGASTVTEGAVSIGWSTLVRASINSRTVRPFSVIFQPPLSRSTSPWEKMSRSGTRAASRLVLVAPLPAAGRKDRHVTLNVVHHGESTRVGHQDLQHRDLKIHRRVSPSAPHGRRPGKGFATDLPEAFGRDLSAGGRFQDFRCDVRACSGLARRNALAHFVEDCAQNAVVAVSNMRCLCVPKT